FGDADADSIAAAFERFGTAQLVVKPQISAGSDRTVRLARGDPPVSLPAAILQPYLPAIVEEGELSLLYVDGAFSHAVRKRARADDFRCQPQYGGTLSLAEPLPGWRAVAGQALAALPAPPLYARVDLIRLADGSAAVMEVEAIEPDLYADLAPDVADRLAAAIARRVLKNGDCP
ncbi:MAG: hypothetical protein K2Y03_08480, partial [Sphingomonas sp.]|nr:hypothetical protein [Sphingomonas sp.]